MAAIKRGAWAGLLLIVVGCPWFEKGDIRFTSADVESGYFRTFFDGVPFDAAPTEEDGNGEDAPREIVEPDITRLDGDTLFVLNQFRGLTSVSLASDTILGRAPIFGYPRDLYIENDRAYVVVSQAHEVFSEDNTVVVTFASRVHILDISDPSTLIELAEFDLAGDVLDSRLVGDVLYVVTTEYGYSVGVPEVADFGETVSYVKSINVGDPDHIHVADEVRFDGAGHVIHVTAGEVYVASPSHFGDVTDITVIDIGDPAGSMIERGVVSVRGAIADRFKMDAWNGTLRVITRVWRERSEVYVTTVDLESLEVITEFRLEDASGDALFATRFDGPLAYVVTYFVVDPLFVIDLSDPAAPIVRAPLEVPGFSVYIEPMGDRLLALGVDDSDGTRRVGVSLFDVSGDPQRIAHVSFGEEWSWSTAFADVKALSILDETIIVPFSGWEEDFGGFDRLQFISYTRDSLELRGFVDLDGSVLRSLEYEDFFFGLTTEQLARIDATNLDAPEVLSTVTLAENIIDFAEIAPGLGVEIIPRQDDAVTTVRIVDAAFDALGEVSVDIGAYADVFVSDTGVVLVGTDYNDQGSFYVVAVIDVSTPVQPVVVGQIRVHIEPYYGFFFGPVPLEPFVDSVSGQKSILPPEPFPGSIDRRAFLLGPKLVLRGYSARTDRFIGGQETHEVLALVDIAALEWEETVGLGAARILSLDQAGDRLYLGTKENIVSLIGRPLCAYFLREIDLLGGTEGPRVNVPGAFVQYDPGTDVLTLRDYSWAPDGDIEARVRTVRWDGGEAVEPVDSFELPGFGGPLKPAGDRLYFAVFDEGFTVKEISVSNDGLLGAGASRFVSDHFGSVLGAKDENVFVSVAGAAVAGYDFSDDARLTQLEQTMGYPSILRFGAERVYVPLGYFGIVSLAF